MTQRLNAAHYSAREASAQSSLPVRFALLAR
jgi:hypothetical protein